MTFWLEFVFFSIRRQYFIQNLTEVDTSQTFLKISTFGVIWILLCYVNFYLYYIIVVEISILGDIWIYYYLMYIFNYIVW